MALPRLEARHDRQKKIPPVFSFLYFILSRHDEAFQSPLTVMLQLETKGRKGSCDYTQGGGFGGGGSKEPPPQRVAAGLLALL